MISRASRRVESQETGAAAATEASEAGVAGARPPDHYMYVCGEGAAGARYECGFEAGGPGDQPPFEDHMFGEFGKERHVAVVVGGELYREDLPFDKRKEEPLLLQPPDAPHHAHPHPPPPPAAATTATKKSDKKKGDNNGIKKKKTRSVCHHLCILIVN